MKIYFIVPPSIYYIEPYAFTKADQNNASRPALGLLYVAAALREAIKNITIKIIDMRLSQLSLKDLRTQLSTEKPDIVGFSVLTFNLLNCLEVCKIVKTATPHTKICFGGWHPTLYPHETVNLAPVDFVVVGEGETTCVELVNILSKHPHSYKDYLHTIYGLGYKNQHGQCVINPNRALIQNLDAIPFPAYELINLKNYTNLLACTNNIANIITTRGCPYACSFCDIRRSRYRTRSPQNVLQEIKFLVDKGITEFFLQDDNFTLDRKRTIKFCQLLIEEKLNIQYKISSRVNHIDNEIASYLKKSGCYRIYFGVESGSQEVLNYLEKGITLEQIKNAFYFAHKHKIDCFAYIMIGAPHETLNDIHQTLKLIKEIKPQHLHCAICTAMPQTKLYQNLLNNKTIAHDYWRAFATTPNPDFQTPFISQYFDDKTLRKMQNTIQRNFYLKPRIILAEILKTKDITQFLRKAKMALKMALT